MAVISRMIGQKLITTARVKFYFEIWLPERRAKVHVVTIATPVCVCVCVYLQNKQHNAI